MKSSLSRLAIRWNNAKVKGVKRTIHQRAVLVTYGSRLGFRYSHISSGWMYRLNGDILSLWLKKDKTKKLNMHAQLQGTFAKHVWHMVTNMNTAAMSNLGNISCSARPAFFHHMMHLQSVAERFQLHPGPWNDRPPPVQIWHIDIIEYTLPVTSKFSSFTLNVTFCAILKMLS